MTEGRTDGHTLLYRILKVLEVTLQRVWKRAFIIQLLER